MFFVLIIFSLSTKLVVRKYNFVLRISSLYTKLISMRDIIFVQNKILVFHDYFLYIL